MRCKNCGIPIEKGEFCPECSFLLNMREHDKKLIRKDEGWKVEVKHLDFLLEERRDNIKNFLDCI